jgi:hypothetical protein
MPSTTNSSTSSSPVDELPRCPACHDVLGVYEPIMHVTDASARLTSRAVEPVVSSSEGEWYHLDCYERIVGTE